MIERITLPLYMDFRNRSFQNPTACKDQLKNNFRHKSWSSFKFA